MNLNSSGVDLIRVFVVSRLGWAVMAAAVGTGVAAANTPPSADTKSQPPTKQAGRPPKKSLSVATSAGGGSGGGGGARVSVKPRWGQPPPPPKPKAGSGGGGAGICGRFPAMTICGCTTPCRIALKRECFQLILPVTTTSSSSSTTTTSAADGKHPNGTGSSGAAPRTRGLYLGSIQAAWQLDRLRAGGITHIVDVSYSPYDQRTGPGGFQYLRLEAHDNSGFNISALFAQTNAFIHRALTDGSSVLVHCEAGISRSTTIVCAYLIWAYGVSAQAGLAHIASKRAVAHPNDGFVRQLESYSMSCEERREELKAAASSAAAAAASAAAAGGDAKSSGATSAGRGGGGGGKKNGSGSGVSSRLYQPKKKPSNAVSDPLYPLLPFPVTPPASTAVAAPTDQQQGTNVPSGGAKAGTATQ